MEKFDNDLKTSLDEFAFKGIELNEKEKYLFINKIKNTSPQKTVKRFSVILPSVAVIVAVVLAFILSRNLIINEISASDIISRKATEEFGQNVIIPEVSEYPITFAAITKLKGFKGPVDLTVYYSAKKGEIDSSYNSNEKIKRWEEAQHSKLLYGPFQGTNEISLQYRRGKSSGNSEMKNKITNGFEVQYQHMVKDSGEFYTAYFNDHNGGIYYFNMRLNDHFSINQAEGFLDNFTRELKQKE
ncbi:hypothetical protein [Neobacillus terrae]|uniref:hypothetical protein n=1 Tax=Neobacillus terrae TaxID=3034837 RepID=UPI0014075A5F|nr:hypothetical protein [Neobacillus terrae]NHM32014.1 hypothetical protein [Neobacillus terrae]